MAEASESKHGYPYMSLNVWAELKKAFNKSLPSKITINYLQSILGSSSDKAAKNLMPQLRTVGLVDDSLSTTPLADEFRMDADYFSAADKIVSKVYPDELRNLYPGPEEDLQKVAEWIQRDTRGGAAGSLAQARFYLGLVSGKLPTGEKVSRTTRAKPEGEKAAPAAPKRQTVQKETPKEKEPEQQRKHHSSDAPEVHLDIQVHIDASASVETIDAVFASMAKHLYQRD